MKNHVSMINKQVYDIVRDENTRQCRSRLKFFHIFFSAFLNYSEKRWDSKSDLFKVLTQRNFFPEKFHVCVHGSNISGWNRVIHTYNPAYISSTHCGYTTFIIAGFMGKMRLTPITPFWLFHYLLLYIVQLEPQSMWKFTNIVKFIFRRNVTYLYFWCC